MNKLFSLLFISCASLTSHAYGMSSGDTRTHQKKLDCITCTFSMSQTQENLDHISNSLRYHEGLLKDARRAQNEEGVKVFEKRVKKEKRQLRALETQKINYIIKSDNEKKTGAKAALFKHIAINTISIFGDEGNPDIFKRCQNLQKSGVISDESDSQLASLFIDFLEWNKKRPGVFEFIPHESSD